jgi:Phytanoyl-CoA dioxygenase (PhyH)
MLSQQEVAHFTTFGFVVFRGLLSDSEIVQLREEVTATLASAYGDRFADDSAEVAAEPAFDLPTMTSDTPLAASLVADDPRFWQVSHHLMGGPTVPTNGEVTCFRANAKWHADLTKAVTGVKFMVYLDPCSAEAGQLQVIPGSHLGDTGSTYWTYLTQDPRRQGYANSSSEWPVPAYGIDTQPGDVIAFHANLMHSSVAGNRRLLWDVYYLSDPILQDAQQRETVRDAILHIGDYGNIPFDHDKWPVWRDWAASRHSDAVVTAVNRLSRLDVLHTEGADIGTPKWEPRLAKPSTVWSSGSPAARRANR